MSASKIVVRRIPFTFDEQIDPVWHPARAEWSHMVNGASLAMPYLEPFLIRTVTEALRQVKDPALAADVRAFIGQEGVHFQNHRRYNEILKRSYPELAAVEADMEADYARFQTRSLRWRLAYTAGFETMTMGITEWLIHQRALLFGDADRSVASLVLWHMVEETEHKTVAFDLYQHLFGRYWPRVWGTLFAAWHVARASRKGYRAMLKRDGRWTVWKSRRALWAMVGRFARHASPAILRSLSPSYHPSRVRDPDWVDRWFEAYQGLPEGRIPLLDTADPEIPARFTA
ncbi:metal-dependent hydrolase [Phenylobacterium sp.]|uniref:metal-dependent hydrolase n=1 Tax=Phenylobacterium sp. TaxID=1871053 RepID=UPI003D2A8C78